MKDLYYIDAHKLEALIDAKQLELKSARSRAERCRGINSDTIEKLMTVSILLAEHNAMMNVFNCLKRRKSLFDGLDDA